MNARRPALLVVTDQHYPGLRATVDGQSAPVYRADYVFRAVAVSAGSHRVVMTFDPASVWQGFAIAGAAITLTLIAGLGVALRGSPTPCRAAREPGRQRSPE